MSFAQWKIMSQTKGGDGPQYDGMLHCWYECAKRDGVASLWTGFATSAVAESLKTGLRFTIKDLMDSFATRAVYALAGAPVPEGGCA
jgi:hypothetical protein